MSELTPLESKTAIVVGASRGLGHGIVDALAALGTRVIAIARDKTRLEASVAKLRGVVPVAADASDDGHAWRLLKEERPDVVVLCAGVSPSLRPIHLQTWQTFSEPWEVDTKTAFVWLRGALLLPMKRGSQLIVVSSGAAIQGSPLSGGYAGAKRTTWWMADYAAMEAARLDLGVRIKCVLPNLNPSTELGRAAIAAYAERASVPAEEFAKKFGPPLTPEIMGHAVVTLLRDPNRYSDLAYRVGGAGLAPLGA